MATILDFLGSPLGRPIGAGQICRILRKEREAGRAECLGRGPDAKWRRV